MTREEFIRSLQPIEQDLMKFYEAFLSQLPKWPDILEVGSGWGMFTRACMGWTSGKVTTIDKIGGYGLERFVRHTAGFDERITRMVEDSHVLLPRMEEKWRGKFDLIFVDGDHTQDGAAKDLRDAWPLLKPGGTMLVDDVFHKYNWQYFENAEKKMEFNFGVTRALWGFIQANRDSMSGIEIVPVVHGMMKIRKFV